MRAIQISDEHYRWWMLVAVIIGAFMSILDGSIVNIALPKMMSVFSVNTTKIQWVATAYTLAMGVVQPASAYLGNTFGQKKLYVSSLAIFTFGSMLCGMAWNNDSMIAFRIIQALGGGMIMPVSLALVYATFPPEQRGTAIGIWGISAMIAPSIGPTLGGYIVENLDWRVIFTINIPIGIFGVLFALLVMRETPIRKSNFDLAGFLSIAVSLFCLILALNKGQDEGWGSVFIVSLLLTAIASMATFIAIELYHPEPLLDVRLFKDLAFSASNIFNLLITVALFGTVFLLPLFLENLQGYTAMQTGLTLFPQSVASGLCMPISGKLTDKGYGKIVMFVGMGMLAIGSLGLIYLDLNTPLTVLKMFLVCRGIGLGLCMMPATNLGMINIPLPKIASASSINNVVRQIGSSFGVAMLSTMLERREAFHTAMISERLAEKSIQVNSLITQLQHSYIAQGSSSGVAHSQAFGAISRMIQTQSAIFSFDDCLALMLLVVVVSLIPVFFLPAREEKPA